MTQVFPSLSTAIPIPTSPMAYFLKGGVVKLRFWRPVSEPSRSVPERSTQRHVTTFSIRRENVLRIRSKRNSPCSVTIQRKPDRGSREIHAILLRGLSHVSGPLG